jgi:hypothetical protein
MPIDCAPGPYRLSTHSREIGLWDRAFLRLLEMCLRADQEGVGLSSWVAMTRLTGDIGSGPQPRGVNGKICSSLSISDTGQPTLANTPPPDRAIVPARRWPRWHGNDHATSCNFSGDAEVLGEVERGSTLSGGDKIVGSRI